VKNAELTGQVLSLESDKRAMQALVTALNTQVAELRKRPPLLEPAEDQPLSATLDGRLGSIAAVAASAEVASLQEQLRQAAAEVRGAVRNIHI